MNVLYIYTYIHTFMIISGSVLLRMRNIKVVEKTSTRILDNDQLDTHLFYFTICLLHSSTCFEHYMPVIRRLNCIDAASGIVTLSKWPSGAQVERELLRPVRFAAHRQPLCWNSCTIHELFCL